MSLSRFTKSGWIGLSSTAALTSGATVQAAAAVDAPTQSTPFADGTVEAGATKARDLLRLSRAQRQQHQEEMMATIAKRLNSTDIKDVAAHIQGLR